MSQCCGENTSFDGVSPAYRRALWIVIGLNASMFAVELSAGHMAGSKALQADALDFLGDTMTYGLSLAVLGHALRRRALAAMVKGLSLSLMGLWVFASTFFAYFVQNVPAAPIMSGVGVLALAANVASVLVLLRFKDGDANVRSVWLCSRNDAIGNVAVILSGGIVWLTHSALPDLIVATVMAGLFVTSSVQILRQARHELNHAKGADSGDDERYRPLSEQTGQAPGAGRPTGAD